VKDSDVIDPEMAELLWAVNGIPESQKLKKPDPNVSTYRYPELWRLIVQQSMHARRYA
jgi:hypothetical protein